MPVIYKYVNKSNSIVVIDAYTIPPSGEIVSTSSIPILDQHDGVLLDRYVDGVPSSYEYNPWHITAQDSIVMPKTAGKGIQVDVDSPSPMWFDLLGDIKIDVNNAVNRPDFNAYIDGIRHYQFLVDDQVWLAFHLTHDYLPGSDMFIHGHWSHNSATLPTGEINFGFDITYAKGHNQESFNPPITITGTASLAIPQYRHMISEFQMSNNGGTGGLIDSNRLEPDGIILVRAYLNANTSDPLVSPFLHYVDIHYQSTGIGTKQKAPNFYV